MSKFVCGGVVMDIPISTFVTLTAAVMPTGRRMIQVIGILHAHRRIYVPDFVLCTPDPLISCDLSSSR